MKQPYKDLSRMIMFLIRGRRIVEYLNYYKHVFSLFFENVKIQKGQTNKDSSTISIENGKVKIKFDLADGKYKCEMTREIDCSDELWFAVTLAAYMFGQGAIFGRDYQK